MISIENNLDWIAANHAQEVIKKILEKVKDKKASDVENTVTKALGVLQENGIYACFLYLLAKEKQTGQILVQEMLNLLNKLNIGWGKLSEGKDKAEDILSHIANNDKINLEKLLLTKETLEQMLIYARYGAKARQAEEPKDEPQQQEASS